MLYFFSTYNKIIATGSQKKCYNTITKKSIRYTSLIRKAIKQALRQQLEYAEKDPGQKVLQIVTAELLYRGIIVPIDKKISEEEYLNKITFILPINQTFFKCSQITEEALSIAEEKAIIFCGIPYDIGAKYPGTRFGPELLRSRSRGLVYRADNPSILEITEKRDIFQNYKIYDLGDINLPLDMVTNSLERVKHVIKLFSSKSIPFVVGGDHLFTLPLIEGLYEKFQGEFTVIQLDNHLDIQLWGNFKNKKPYKLSTPTHSNFISWLKNKYPKLDLYQIGVNAYQSVKSSDAKAACDYLKNIGQQITNNEIMLLPRKEILDRIPVSKRVYLTIDVDVLNVVHMNTTGYPASVGIDMQEFFCIVDYITKNNSIIGIDIMEFGKNSKYDEHLSTSDLICNLILIILKNVLK